MFKHNDIHPDNIMIHTKHKKQIVKFNKNKYLLDSPDIKIIDFGESTFKKSISKKKTSLKSATMLKNIVKTNVLLIDKIYKYKNENADKHFIYTIALLLLSGFKNIKVPKLTSYKSFLKNNLFDDLKLTCCCNRIILMNLYI